MKRNDTGQFESGTELEGEYKDWHDEYMGWTTPRTDNERTRERLRRGSRKWFGWCQDRGIDPIDDASESLVNGYIDALRGEGYAGTSISRLFSTVSKIYHWIDTDIEKPDVENPTAEISLPRDHDIRNDSHYVTTIHRDGRGDIIAPPQEDILQVCDNATGQRGRTRLRNETILRLMWHTALRSDELSRLKLANVDFDEREIVVRSSKLNPHQHPDLYHRRVWWGPSLDYTLARYRDSIDDDNTYLFTGERGGKLDPQYISQLVKDAATEAGLQEPLAQDKDGNVSQHLYTAHRFRHARISHLANEAEMPLQHLRLFSGHAKVETTMQYVRTDWSAARESYRTALEDA